MQLVVREAQGPFLTQVIEYGKLQQQLSAAELADIRHKGVLMSVKFADKFYNKYKMHLLEQAAYDVIGVVSLGLAELSEQDVSRALTLLKSAEGLVKPFQKGWSMLVTVSQAVPGRKSLYGDVEEKLVQDISTPPDTDEWHGWASYQQALQDHHRRQALQTLRKQFFHASAIDDLFEHHNLEGLLAEVILYRVVVGPTKVRQDLKQHVRQEPLAERWFQLDYLSLQLEATLAELPEALRQAIRADLGDNFQAALLKTLEFAKKYQQQAQKGASPERLDAFEHQEGMKSPLLGWPQYIEM